MKYNEVENVPSPRKINPTEQVMINPNSKRKALVNSNDFRNIKMIPEIRGIHKMSRNNNVLMSDFLTFNPNQISLC
jgi:hypothetical protein